MIQKDAAFIGIYIEMPVLPFLCYSNSSGCQIYIYYKRVGGREAENFHEVWNSSFCVSLCVPEKIAVEWSSCVSHSVYVLKASSLPFMVSNTHVQAM